jgi:hypothetical protein
MRRAKFLARVIALTSVSVACSPGAGKGGGVGDNGQGGGMNGGTTSIGGSIANGGTGATGAVIGNGGGNMAGSGGMPKTCLETTVNTEPLIPTIAIVVDNSSSMYRPESDPPFDKLQDALMDPTTGAIKPLEGKMRLGFYSFRSPKNHAVPETDPTCADMTSVPFALDNYDEVNAAYQQVGVDRLRPTGCAATPNMSGCEARDWDTPTGFALNKVAADLIAYNPDPPGKKNILFVTDGTPNTCMIGDPNCGQDQTIKAYQDAFAAGIGGYIVGIGDALGESCDPNATHCGADYLQDMANAGAGQPVAQQPMSYWYQQCATTASGTNPGTPLATYVAAGQAPGTADFFTAMTSAELLSALTELLSTFVSCTFDMDSIVTGNAANSLVTLQGMPLTFGDTAAGWVLESNKYQVTLTGTACEEYKRQSATQEGAEVRIVFYCDPETGRPEIEPR